MTIHFSPASFWLLPGSYGKFLRIGAAYEMDGQATEWRSYGNSSQIKVAPRIIQPPIA